MAARNNGSRRSAPTASPSGRGDFWSGRLTPVHEASVAGADDDHTNDLRVYDDRDEHDTIHVQWQYLHGASGKGRLVSLTYPSVEALDEAIADLQEARAQL